MQFTPQQLAGAGRYSHKTRIGNWNEDQALEEVCDQSWGTAKTGRPVAFISLCEAAALPPPVRATITMGHLARPSPAMHLLSCDSS